MKQWLWRERGVRVGAAVLVCAAGLDMLVAWHAIHLEIDPRGQPAPVSSPRLRSSNPAPDYDFQRVLAAIAKDPFHPERRRPGRRFLAPLDHREQLDREADRQFPATMLRLIGTAVAPNGAGFAMCEAPGAAPRIVRIGEQVAGWTLKKVTQGSAEFATPGGPVVVHVPKAGS